MYATPSYGKWNNEMTESAEQQVLSTDYYKQNISRIEFNCIWMIEGRNELG